MFQGPLPPQISRFLSLGLGLLLGLGLGFGLGLGLGFVFGLGLGLGLGRRLEGSMSVGPRVSWLTPSFSRHLARAHDPGEGRPGWPSDFPTFSVMRKV